MTEARARPVPRTRRLVWGTRFSTEGSPILVADLDEYVRWGGGERAERPAHVVHFYGPLVKKLPTELTPGGSDSWHQYLEVPTLEDASDAVDRLRREVERLVPDAARRAQTPMDFREILEKARGPVAEWLPAWRDTIEKGIDFEVNDEVALHVDVSPATDYGRGCRALGENDAVGLDGRRAFMWRVHGGAVIEVGRARRGVRPELVLVRSSTNDRDNKLVRAHVQSDPTETEIGSLDVRDGIVIAADSVFPPTDVVQEGVDPGPVLRAAADLVPPVQLHSGGMLNVGTILTSVPGSHRVSVGQHEEDGWSCSWCRLLGPEPS